MFCKASSVTDFILLNYFVLHKKALELRPNILFIEKTKAAIELLLFFS
jgi:hypothetical protein